MFGSYVRAKGKIIKADKLLDGVRLLIDVHKLRISKVFAGDADLNQLKNKVVLVYLPKIKSKKEMPKLNKKMISKLSEKEIKKLMRFYKK